MDAVKRHGRIVLTIEFERGLLNVCRRMGHVPRDDGTARWVNERLGYLTVTTDTEAATIADYLLSWALTYKADGVTKTLTAYARKHQIALPEGLPVIDPGL